MVDNLIRLFESTAIDFSDNGIGSLPDATTCVVTEERNGEYELEMDYPINGIRYDEIIHRRIIVAKPNQYADPQPFRIYAISKPIGGIVTINAAHISYDLSGYTVSPFYAVNITNAITDLATSIDQPCPFTFESNKQTVGDINIVKPMSVRSVLGGVEGSILDVYHGEYEFDGLTVKLWENRGQDRGVVISYGKNLTDLTQEENCNEVYTAIRPYWYKDAEDSSGGLVDLPEKTIAIGSGQQNYTKVLSLDLSDSFDEKPTVSQLRSAANAYINSHDLDKPNVSIEVSFVQLSDSKEYTSVVLSEEVHLCDIVTVEFPMMGVSAKSKCIKTVFDVLTQKYTSIELGDAKSNLATTVSDNSKAIEEAVTTSSMERAVTTATKMVTGNLGGYVRLNDSNLDGEPDEILIMDTADIETATNVWRWNQNGLGFSSTGYDGTYGTAITADGQVVADYITAGILNADLIKAGTIADVQGNSNINLANGNARMINFTATNYINIEDAIYHYPKITLTTSSIENNINMYNGTAGRSVVPRLFLSAGQSGGSIMGFQGLSTSWMLDKDGFRWLNANTMTVLHFDVNSKKLLMKNDSAKTILDFDADDKHIWMKDGNDHNRIELYSTDGQISLINNSNVGSISLTGSTGVIICVDCQETSSRKAKENIKPMDKDEAYKILDLEAVSFDFKEKESGTNKRGFIAEDVEEILPNLVTPETDGRLASLSYTGMIPYLQTVIKDQEKRIKALEEKLGGTMDGTD